MAIIQISKIQHRRGLSNDLPQLASAELGWSVDTRQLYIGNGTIDEGAPTIGNTEILTEYSDILGVAQTYTYQGASGGYIVQTGETVNTPVQRTLQSKLDDIVNVRDFGATGDGTTNDLAAINRALYELFCRAPNNTLSRRTLYFPAGTYIISGGVVKVPTYARIIGDGANKTSIVQTDAGQDCVMKTADSYQQIDTNIGAAGATLPQFIQVSQMTLQNTTSNNVLEILSANTLSFRDVLFIGNRTNPATSSSISCVTIDALTSPSVISSYNINFSSCAFLYSSTGITINSSNVVDVSVKDSFFFTLYQGISIGETVVVDPRPTGIKISHSVFDEIFNSAIHSYDAVSGVYSIGNHFKDVANSFSGTGNPTAPVIEYASDECYSISDQFDRPSADILDHPLIERGSNTGGPQGLSQGRQTIGSGTSATLTDNTSSATTINSFTATNAIIEYSIERGIGYTRSGLLKLAAGGYDDEYQETADCGVTLSVSSSAGTQSLKYTTTSTGDDATLTYSIKYFS